MQIYPSILERDIATLFRQLNKLLPVFDYAQIDIADGVFVETRTIQIDDIISYLDANPTALNVPLEQKTFEFHLMIENFEPELLKIERLKKYLNIICVIIHVQPFARHNFTVPNTNFKIGMALNPEDTVADHIKSLQLFDIAQIMTVNPGKQGQPFTSTILINSSTSFSSDQSHKQILKTWNRCCLVWRNRHVFLIKTFSKS
jgi:pentose-5-phosphate-3-epimerase